MMFFIIVLLQLSFGIKLSTFLFGNLSMLTFESVFSSSTVLFSSLVMLISMTVFNWAGSYMSSKFKLVLFFYVLTVFVLSMLMLILSNSFFSLFLGWEGLGVSSFLLILFYQNWSSAKGALLTLLTNRMGDGLLLFALSYWLSSSFSLSKSTESLFLVLLLFFVSCTKSAQWPFINWLPAAMAAPTPVSALVHSSTLVTAGVWMFIRYSHLCISLMAMCSLLGLVTLLVASFAALAEKDGKKVVALSTLSQLGLMYLSLGLGSSITCIFHILMHALAKANLFMLVGELLHKSFSQQDMRFLSTTSFSKVLAFSMSISLGSLLGMFFLAGFFSKEQVLMSENSLISSTLAGLILVLVSSLTLSYSFCLIKNTMSLNSNSGLIPTSQSALSLCSILTLSTGTVTLGWVVSFNLSTYGIWTNSLYGFFWALPLLGFLFFSILIKKSFLTGMGFYVNNKEVDLLFLSTLKDLSTVSSKVESSNVEVLNLVLNMSLGLFWKVSTRILLVLIMLIAFLALL